MSPSPIHLAGALSLILATLTTICLVLGGVTTAASRDSEAAAPFR